MQGNGRVRAWLSCIACAAAAGALIIVSKTPTSNCNMRQLDEESMPELNVQVRELWLSSEDTGAYGRDLGTPLPQLLTALTGVLGEVPAAPDGGPRIMMRLGMTNPPFILEHLQAVAQVRRVPRWHNTHKEQFGSMGD